MKFGIHINPSIPASPEERERLRPIAHRTDKIQQVLAEQLELAQMAEDLGFDMVTFSEHHFYTEGCEAGATPTPHLMRLLFNTKRVKIGPLGFVLPTWDPIRLALDVAWADQMSRGRVVVGLARGVFPRWVNVLGQQYSVSTSAAGPEAELHNHEVFEELFEVLKLAWADEPFSFNGKFYKVPFPPEGIEWPAYEATLRYGAPGEVDQKGWLSKVSPVPKPYQKPHPQIFQAFSGSERTMRWAAREGVIPVVFAPYPEHTIRCFDIYAEEAAKHGRSLRRGESVGLSRMIYIGDSHDDAMRLMRKGGVFLFTHFHSKVKPIIPSSVEGFNKINAALLGTVDDVRRQLEDVEETLHPEYLIWNSDQGYLSLYEAKKQLELFGTKVMPQFRG